MLARKSQPFFILLLTAFTLSSVGCGSYAISRMPSEDTIPSLAVSKQNAARYYTSTTLVPTSLDDNTNQIFNIALHETGSDSSNQILVMLHGVFTDHSSWRYVQGSLVDDYTLWLLDMPGCGDSDAPPVDDTFWQYAPQAMAERVLQVLSQKIAQLESPPELTIVAHSLSGQVVLRALSDPQLRDQYSNVLEHINAAILLSPLDIADPTPQSASTNIIRLSSNTINISWNLGLLELRIAQATRNAFPDPNMAPREEALKRIEILRDPVRRRAMQAMLRQAIPKSNGVLDRPAVTRIEANYQSIDIPVLILWGRQDNVLPVSMAFKLARQIPTAELLVFDNSKHSIHHDSPAICASVIDSFARTHAAPIPTIDSIHLAVKKPYITNRDKIKTSASAELSVQGQ